MGGGQRGARFAAAAGVGSETGRLGNRPPLTGVRAVAVTMVLVQHVHLGPIHDARGVDLFFVLSGFLITILLLEEIAGRQHLDFGRFYIRRLLRLYPALAVMVVVSSVVFWVWGPPDWHERIPYGATMALTYLTNFARGLWQAPVEPFEHTRSLAVEEQFYLLWPITLWGIHRVFRGRAAAVVGSIAALVVVATAYSFWYYGATHDFVHLYVGLDGRAVELLGGCLLGALYHGGWLDRLAAGVGTRVWPVLGWASLAALVLLMDVQPFGGGPGDRTVIGLWDFPVSGVLAGLLICSVVLAPGSLLASVLSVRPVIWLGLVSYAFYLWHVPVIWAFQLNGIEGWWLVLLAFAASLALSSASFVLIERPIGRWRDRVTGRSPNAPPRSTT